MTTATSTEGAPRGALRLTELRDLRERLAALLATSPSTEVAERFAEVEDEVIEALAARRRTAPEGRAR